MRYHERLNIIFMRDNGPRRSYSIRRSRFYLLILFFACLPFLCALLTVQCWLLWEENRALRENVERFEVDFQAAEQRAERLQNLEELLQEQNVPARDMLLRQLATEDKTEEAAPTASPEPEMREETIAEGPGHEEFPALDTGRIKVSNVQARAQRGHSLRIGLDLRNTDPEQLLSGNVSAILVTASGERLDLGLNPDDAGAFRISRFKRAVMTASAPRDANLINAQVIIEVKDQEGQPLYRNIFAVQR